MGRPNAHLCEAFRRQGINIEGRGEKESVPIVFNGGELCRPVAVDGSLSSQFISALLIALPSLEIFSACPDRPKEMVSRIISR